MAKQLDYIVTDTVGGAGASVCWTLHGECSAADLEDALAAQGVSRTHAPSTPTPTVALRRALHVLAERRQLVRPLEHRGEYAVVTEKVRGGKLAHSHDRSVRLNAAGRPVFDGVSYAEQDAVLTAYDRTLERLDHTDISAWLCRMATKVCDGVPLREGGGFYYIPPTKLALWRAVAEAVESVSDHRVYEMPTMKSDQAVRLILDSLEADTAREAAAVRDDLLEGKLGDKARVTKTAAVQSLEAKVARYEELLGAKLDGFKASLETLRASLAVDTLQSDKLAALADLFG